MNQGPANRVGVMLDTESLGLLPGSIMREFAMVAFDLDDPETILHEHSVMFPLETQEVLGRKISLGTVVWMLDDGAHLAARIRENMLGDLEELSAHIRVVNRKFQQWTAGANYEVWVRRPQHDVPMIESLWNSVGESLPWHYTKVNDLATLMNEAGLEKVEIDTSGIALHTALGDCQFQIRQYAAARSKLSANV